MHVITQTKLRITDKTLLMHILFVIVMNIIYSSHIIHLWKKAHNYEIRIQRIDM